MQNTKTTRPAAWTAEEDRAIVRDYLDMMAAQKRGEKVNKTATRVALLSKLNGRSESAVEFKRCNVSACLRDLGREWLAGYRPADNYQRSLADVVRVALLAEINAEQSTPAA